MLIPALNTPVGANWDLMTCQPNSIIYFDTNLSSYSHSYPETLNFYTKINPKDNVTYTHYKLQVNTCMFEANKQQKILQKTGFSKTLSSALREFVSMI